MTTIDDVHSIYLASESKVDQARDRFALTEGYISSDEAVSPWVPLNEGVWLRYVTFDVRSSTCANVMWVREEGSVGRHRHRGPVAGITLEGSWRYLEYDWVAKAGDYIRESPGRSHTLYSDTGMKTLFTLNGAVEMLDDIGRVFEVLDVFWFINHYTSYCEENGIPINNELFL